jgi:uncharacterized Zn finger protein (UPF0148 family)
VLRLSLVRFDQRVLVEPSAMAAKKCRECGAELDFGPTLCPLCGHDPDKDLLKAKLDGYQSEVRELKERLKALRDEGAEAV